MKSVFDASTREELAKRAAGLSPASKALWGKMNVSQMLKHCALCDDMFFGRISTKRAFIGRLIGKMILKQVLKDDKPMQKNSPTSPALVTTADDGSLEEQKTAWLRGLEQYASYHNPRFVHPFFGSMTPEQVGQLAYKHADHHFRQFGV